MTDGLASFGGAAIVLVVLVGIFVLLLGGMRRGGYAAQTLRGIGTYSLPDNASAFAAGLVATVAVGSVLDLGGSSLGVMIGAGVTIGIFVSLTRSGRVFELGMLLCAVLGIGAIVGGFVTDAACTGLPLLTRILVLVVLGVGALGGAILAGLVGRIRAVSGLAVFSILEILIFVASPLGVPLFVQSPGYAVIAVIAAGLLGLGGALAPGIVIGLGALGVAIASIATAAGFGTTCDSSPSSGSAIALIAFAVLYVIAGRFRRG